MTPRSVKRADILDRRQAGRVFRRHKTRELAASYAVEDMIRRDLARQIKGLDRARERGREAAAQRLRCLIDGCEPVTAAGPFPGARCSPHGNHDVFGPCDDGEGYCPADDCQWFGTCVCLCHEGG